jgi:hypothetical protein
MTLRKWTSVLPLVLMLTIVLPCAALVTGTGGVVRFDNKLQGFPFSLGGVPAPLCGSTSDHPGVLRIIRVFQNDVAKVTGREPVLSLDVLPSAKAVVIVGTLGRCALIDRLVRERRIDVRGIAGEWEASLIQTVEKPFPGVDRALVIAGSDKRGTIYGMFSLSEQIGVSPWYWWADVPVKSHKSIVVLPGRHTDGPPSVKYRGIFLNDEYPALTRWVKGKYGDVAQKQDPPIPAGVANYGHEFYERIFELLLRLKANYLWPAMWDNAFNEDDPENPRLADEYGIVMGTSHQEPMLRAQKEWDRRYKASLGSWNYAKHPDTLEEFWREGIRRNKGYESLVTIGLRGADDTPMAPGGPEANRTLLEGIITTQRKMLAEEINSDVTRIPQLWCLYKEVLEFYKAGMRVPDDVTLLWPDDNWGNIRRLPTAAERARKGGAGVYYHFDYHGGPRSYQWINTNPIAKIWEQMSLAKKYGADRIWIVNVGHFKGYEFPLQFFMDLAWNTGRWKKGNVNEYTRLWAEREFGPEYAADIADIVSKYTKFNGRRKPELLSPTTYSLVNYREWETVVSDFKKITARAEEISQKLPATHRDAFFELVLFPTKASAIVNELYLTAGKNSLYAKQGRSATNETADQTMALFTADTALMGYFNRTFANGKWNHFMDQAHLGYTGWADPPTNSLRAITLTTIDTPAPASMGVAVEGSEAAWPGGKGDATLPACDPFNNQHWLIEVFNKGRVPFTYLATTDKPWILVSEGSGEVKTERSFRVSVDWSKVKGKQEDGTVMISGTGQTVPVRVTLSGPAEITPASLRGFVEGDGHVSMEAEHYTRKTDVGANRWVRVEAYGHTFSAMRATSSVDAPAAVPGKDSPCLEYRMFLHRSGTVEVTGIFGATLNFIPKRAVRYGVSIDNAQAQIVTLVPEDFIAQHDNLDWEKTVGDNARHSRSAHNVVKPGYHTLKIWMVDHGVIIQKIVVDCGGVRPSYLGPPESFFRLDR